jgi:putative FmdB family regulatory protein
MPTYDFECSSCGHQEEIFQSMSASSTKQCPQCDAENCFTVVFLTAPISFVKGEVKTIAQQADRNTKNMGSYELQEKRLKDEISDSVSKKKRETRDRHKAIVSMTPQQQQHWIKTGEKP